MASNHDDKSSIRRYLLNQPTGEAQQQIEQRLLSDDGVLEEVEVAEEELIDEYLAGHLTEDERSRFEQHFLTTPERQQKLRFGRSLSRYVAKAENQEKAAVPFWSHFWGIHNRARLGPASVVIIAIVAGSFWFSRSRIPSPPTFVTHTLTISASNRAESSPTRIVTLPLNAEALRLRLELPEPWRQAVNYRVELLEENGKTSTLRIVAQDEQSVVVEILAAQLLGGQYALHVNATKPDGTEQRSGSYLFTVD